MWLYTLLLPSFADSGWISTSFIDEGPFGLAFLRPRMLFNLQFDPLTHGVLWSLGLNLLAWVAVSLATRVTPAERLQAASFVSAEPPPSSMSFRLWRTSVPVAQLQSTVARYLGEERARRSFAEYAERHGLTLRPEDEADINLLRFAEHLLASAVGAASSRLVLALLLEQVSPDRRGALQLLDDASAAIQYNRDLLQSAIDHVRQGIGVFDRNYNLICWNRQFRALLRLPPDMGRVGVPLEEILRAVVRTACPSEPEDEALARRLECITETFEPYQERFETDGTVLEVRASRMPDGGVVITFADITKRVLAAEALQMANELLEKRVEERTAELMRLNRELAQAKAEAERANLDKTRFIAAASHDILQPLNAARLFTSTLVEQSEGRDPLARNIDASLESVEEILTALLDISRFDAGARKPEYSEFPVDEILLPLAREFAPLAEGKGLRLRAVAALLDISRFDAGARKPEYSEFPVDDILLPLAREFAPRGDEVRLEVHDTGPGIPEDKRELIFREFERLRDDAGREPGLGLGLSIVERISRVLGHALQLRSRVGRGTVFSITVPRARAGGGEGRAAEEERAPQTEKTAQPATVLVVDNEPAILEGMSKLLGGWGCEVICASSGAQAVAAWREREGDIGLVIADYHLDDEDGLGVIETLRALAGWPLPAILITADRSREVQESARSHDVTYLRKPVKPAALRAVMNRVCPIARRPAAE